MRYHPLRWIAFSVFVFSTTLNYLDRTLLNYLAPSIMAEMSLNNIQFGWLISAFSFTYAAVSLFAGRFLDRAGLNRAITAAVCWWSGAAVSTGLAGNFNGLALCRSALGVGESAGIPAVGKLNGLYLKPEERALGTALNGVGLSVGSSLTPIWIAITGGHSWRAPFVISGLLGFVWIPVWLLVQRLIPPTDTPHQQTPQSSAGFSLLRDPPLMALMMANVLWMSGFSLWSNWVTLYLTHVYHITLKGTAVLVWIPPVVSNLGGFFGGWLSMRSIQRGVHPVRARQRAVWASTAGVMSAFALPFMPNAGWATAVIALSFFFVLAGSVNIYALPIDIYGAENAGFTVSALTFAYGVLQAVISPLIGWLADHGLYHQVVWLVTVPAVISSIVLLGCNSKEPSPARY
jgi:ACS family hexuronate transporter-like MFS transporter